MLRKKTPIKKKATASQRRMREASPAWTSFVLSRTKDPTDPEALLFVNDRYQVSRRILQPKDASVPPLAHLSIRRLDRAAIHDWRDLQRIKNELVGVSCEGIEIYPAEERLLDTVNSYHLWVFTDPTFRFGIGFHHRLVAEGPYSNGAVQRPWKPGLRPVDCLDGKSLEQKYGPEFSGSLLTQP